MNLTTHRRSDLTKYNPDKGLKTIAVAEAAEKHYARAKDAGKLQIAIRSKLEAQAEFVFWWDTKATKAQGTHSIAGPGRGKKHKSASRINNAVSVAGRNGLPERSLIDRWRRKLNTPSDFEATFQKARDRYIKILEFRTGSTAGMSYPESNEWYTPVEYIEAARVVMGGIDLDPASSAAANKTVQATKYYSVEDTGLQYEWEGRVWLNPPYSGQAAEFIRRLAESVTTGTVTEAVVLVNSHGTDTSWFQPLWNALLCFTNHRINFISPSSGAKSGSNHGSVFAYFGLNRKIFIDQFSQFGTVVERIGA